MADFTIPPHAPPPPVRARDAVERLLVFQEANLIAGGVPPADRAAMLARLDTELYEALVGIWTGRALGWDALAGGVGEAAAAAAAATVRQVAAGVISPRVAAGCVGQVAVPDPEGDLELDWVAVVHDAAGFATVSRHRVWGGEDHEQETEARSAGRYAGGRLELARPDAVPPAARAALERALALRAAGHGKSA